MPGGQAMSDFEPNIDVERKVVCGVLTHLPFANRFIERNLKTDLFLSKDAKAHAFVVTFATNYTKRYKRLCPIDAIFDSITRRCEKEEKDTEAKINYYRSVLRNCFADRASVDDLDFHLDELVDLYKNYTVLFEAKELKRYYECGFRHGEVEQCKGCPIWNECRQMKESEKSFPDKLIDILQRRLEVVKIVGGVDSASTMEMVSELPTVVADHDSIHLEMMEKQAKGEGSVLGIPTPWPTATEAMQGWQRRCVYGIAAVRKVGKTTSLLNVAEAAVRSGENVLYFQMEDGEEQFKAKFAALVGQVYQTDIRFGSLNHQDRAFLIQRSKDYIQGQKDGTVGRFFTYTKRIRGIGLSDIENQLEMYANQGIPISLFIFDHLHIANISRIKGLSQSEQYREFVETLKVYTQRFNCAGIFAAQLKTSGDRKGSLRWSDELEDSVDGMFFVTENPTTGRLRFSTSVGRAFPPFSFNLVDRRDKALLSEDFEDTDDSLSEFGDLNPSMTEYLPRKD